MHGPASAAAWRYGSFRSYAAPAAEDDDGDALPLFVPKAALPRLPDVRGIPPRELELHDDRRAHKPQRVLLRAIDLEHRVRFDADGRTQLMSRESPSALQTGSIVLVEYVNSRSKARKQYFAGVLMEIRRKGIMSSIVLRNYVMGTGVEMLFPVYSPMVQRIKVLQPADAELLENNQDDITWIRKKACPGIDYSKIDELVARYRSAEERLEKRQRMQQQMQQDQQQ
ncbi:translation protein SH3-like domain-containing protein [Entophlyctis helioformis]|nr:translation protein SH3-like domain-containing protein [Entophlyctis helioformis]